jgi:hypothetical protein
MANDNYDNPTVYDNFDNVTIPAACGCGVVGLVAVKSCSGDILGYLTPNDAEFYNNGTIEVPIGYVKVFHPVTGIYLGILTVAEAEAYITFLTPVAP